MNYTLYKGDCLERMKAGRGDSNGWYCAHCQRGVDPIEVTFHEQHEECGRVITDDKPPAERPLNIRD